MAIFSRLCEPNTACVIKGLGDLSNCHAFCTTPQSTVHTSVSYFAQMTSEKDAQ